MSDSAAVGGDMPPFTYPKSHKLASGKPGSMSNAENMDSFTALYISYVLYTLLLVQMRGTLSLVVMVFLFSSRLFSTNLC